MSYYELRKQRKNVTGSYAEVLSLVSINSAVLNEILENIRLLQGEWMRHDSSNCTNLAVYSVTSLEVFQSGSVGRPRYLISEEILLLQDRRVLRVIK